MDARPDIATAPFRDPRYAPRRLEVERRPDGTVILFNATPIKGAFATVAEPLAHWAAAQPDRVWLAERDGEPVGYALAGPCHLPHPDVTPDCGELWRLYLLPQARGGGLGGRLLNEVLTWLERPGRRLWIGVWSQNHGAQRLYGRLGFQKVGEYLFPVGEVRDHEFILRRDPA